MCGQAVISMSFHIASAPLWCTCTHVSSTGLFQPAEMAENITSRELLDNPFSALPLHNKLRIVNKGQPTPPLPYLIT
jgi:hypothetical protein